MTDKLNAFLEKQFADWSAKTGSDDRLVFAVEQTASGVLALAEWLNVPPKKLLLMTATTLTKLDEEAPHADE